MPVFQPPSTVDYIAKWLVPVSDCVILGNNSVFQRALTLEKVDKAHGPLLKYQYVINSCKDTKEYTDHPLVIVSVILPLVMNISFFRYCYFSLPSSLFVRSDSEILRFFFSMKLLLHVSL